jgi:response regulator of citrate/malate metabolism
LQQVSAHLRSNGPLTAGGLAAGTGISRVTARRYLEYLADSGVVDRRTGRGGVGRPEVIYAWR